MSGASSKVKATCPEAADPRSSSSSGYLRTSWDKESRWLCPDVSFDALAGCGLDLGCFRVLASAGGTTAGVGAGAGAGVGGAEGDGTCLTVGGAGGPARDSGLPVPVSIALAVF
ncbi:hypothetical protein NLX71_11225 [Paenibacillus sp. MZ04-78.2]|nr:hypothetical protein [Paenibacillus sp. MZ04-78.2]